MDDLKRGCDSATYLEARVDRQLQWLSAQAERNKRWFLSLRLLQIVLAGYVTLAASLAQRTSWLPFSITLAGVLITALSSWESINGYQGLWIRYRQTSEKLEREKTFYLTFSPPYRQASFAHEDEAAFATFVARVEAILGAEVEQWSQSAAQPPKPSAARS